MSKYLLVDFGSTYTKLTAVDTNEEKILATSVSFSTVDSDIEVGFNKALKKLENKIGIQTYDKTVACSSAAGGLKMAAIGIVPELTVEAAKRTCMGAGAKVDMVFSYKLTKSDIRKIKESDIDIILLAGGTDGGNTEIVLHNIEVIAKADLGIPVIYAGNKNLDDEARMHFEENNVSYFIADNIMSKLNQLNMNSAKKLIHEVFLKRIISAKGIKKIENRIDQVLLPTPDAVLKASMLLSHGFDDIPGWGELMVVDVGGATTDIYSMSHGYPTRIDVMMKGLEEPYDKRTVEGDLGVRYSAIHAMEEIPRTVLNKLKESNIDIESEIQKRVNNPSYIPHDLRNHLIEEAITLACVNVAVKRHAGTLEQYYTSQGMVYYQLGKNLLRVQKIIGTGGNIINSPNPKDILRYAEGNQKDILDLRPHDPTYYLDKDYILSAMGLLSLIDPKCALKLLKKHIIKI